MVNKLNSFLNDPFGSGELGKTGYLLARYYFFISFAAIALTPLLFFLEVSSFLTTSTVVILIKNLNLFILYFFTLDLLLQIISAKKTFRYLTSLNGIIDLLAVIPTWVSIIFGLGVNSSAFRILRLLRFGKLFSNLPTNSFLSGFRGKLFMLTVAIVGIKLVVVTFEGHPFWPEFENVGVILGLVTFSLAMLLGTKLGVLNTRLYSIEDAICRCVGGLKIFWESDHNHRVLLKTWSENFYDAITNPTKEKVSVMRVANNTLYQSLVVSQNGPNLANFTRDVAFILHRATAISPKSYENLLRDITVIFTTVIIFVIPGLTGLVSVLVLSYVFFGMFYLVDDMDRPLDYSEGSLITANIEPLEEFNNNH